MLHKFMQLAERKKLMDTCRFIICKIKTFKENPFTSVKQLTRFHLSRNFQKILREFFNHSHEQGKFNLKCNEVTIFSNCCLDAHYPETQISFIKIIYLSKTYPFLTLAVYNHTGEFHHHHTQL